MTRSTTDSTTKGETALRIWHLVVQEVVCPSRGLPASAASGVARIHALWRNPFHQCARALQGNHELESIDGGPEGFVAYEARWRMPYEQSGSSSPLYYSYETGPAHVLMLGSYAPYGKHSKQVRRVQWPHSAGTRFMMLLLGPGPLPAVAHLNARRHRLSNLNWSA